MFGPQDDNELDDEEAPLKTQVIATDNQINNKSNNPPVQNKAKKIYPTSCDGSTKPTKFFCTNCQVVLYSKISTSVSKETWFAVIVLCFFPTGGFCLIPLMIDYMKDFIHTCPVCSALVGKREYTISKPLKIIMLVVIIIVVILVIIFIISAIFFGNTMWEEYKRIKGYQKQFEYDEGEEQQ